MSYLFIIFSSIKQLVMFSKILFDGGVFVPQFFQFFLFVNQRTFLIAHNKKITYKNEYSGLTSCTLLRLLL